MQIINQGSLVYSAGIDELLNRQSTQYEIALASRVDIETLISDHAFSAVVQIDEHNFIVDSELSAEQLSEHIVQQQWGLTRFAPRQTSLEQIFIDLTTGDVGIDDDSMDDKTMSAKT